MRRRASASPDILKSLMAFAQSVPHGLGPDSLSAGALTRLVAAGFVGNGPGGPSLTEAGYAALARIRTGGTPDVDPFLKQHLTVARREASTPDGLGVVTIDDSESPLAWLARRKGKDGRPMIDPAQFAAGERLRADFTRAQMMPRVTSSWSGVAADAGRGGGAGEMTDLIVAARQRVRQTLDAVGTEFSGLLLDVCCFLKGLEDVERERGWPSRSGKVVLQLGLDRLARHYGLATVARGRGQADIRTWLAPGASFTAE